MICLYGVLCSLGLHGTDRDEDTIRDSLSIVGAGFKSEFFYDKAGAYLSSGLSVLLAGENGLPCGMELVLFFKIETENAENERETTAPKLPSMHCRPGASLAHEHRAISQPHSLPVRSNLTTLHPLLATPGGPKPAA